MWLDTAILFLFGTILGSFLNALAFRYNTGKSMWGRSACLSCGKTLSAFELVPVLSYLFLHGKCKGCKSAISAQYPFVEISAGVLLVFSYYTSAGNTSLFLVTLAFFSTLLFISIYDLRHTIIPNAFVYSAAALGLIHLFLSIQSGSLEGIDSVAGPLLALPLFLLWIYSHGKWIGLGDAKLMLAVGWFLGISSGLAAFLLSFWIGALVSLALLGLSRFAKGGRRVTMKTEIPFGPFIVLGCAISYFAYVDIFTLTNFF